MNSIVPGSSDPRTKADAYHQPKHIEPNYFIASVLRLSFISFLWLAAQGFLIQFQKVIQKPFLQAQQRWHRQTLLRRFALMASSSRDWADLRAAIKQEFRLGDSPFERCAESISAETLARWSP